MPDVELNAWWVIAAMAASGLLAAWTAAACRTISREDWSAPDAVFWAALAVVLFAYSQLKLAKNLGWLQGIGVWLRDLAKAYALYDDRRPFQIAVTIAIAFAALCIFLYGLYWMAHVLKRYRLAFGFASLAIGCAMIRAVSLHEVDGWTMEMPWLRPTVDLVGAAGASIAAVSRLYSLGEFTAVANRVRRLGSRDGKATPS